MLLPLLLLLTMIVMLMIVTMMFVTMMIVMMIVMKMVHYYDDTEIREDYLIPARAISKSTESLSFFVQETCNLHGTGRESY